MFAEMSPVSSGRAWTAWTVAAAVKLGEKLPGETGCQAATPMVARAAAGAVVEVPANSPPPPPPGPPTRPLTPDAAETPPPPHTSAKQNNQIRSCQ